jgi:hypothetical protein
MLALAGLSVSEAVQCGRRILAQPSSAEAAKIVATGLLAPHDDDARRRCEMLADSPDRETRHLLARAVGRANAAAPGILTDLVVRSIADPDPGVARAALEELGPSPSTAACDVALQALEHRFVRGAAVRALVAMGEPVAERVAQELETHLEDVQRACALAGVLGRVGGEASVAALARAVGAPNVQVRLAAATSLRSIHRRCPEQPLPYDTIAAHYPTEVRFYGRLRQASLAPLIADDAASRLLMRVLRQRGQASLETLFCLLSLRHGETPMRAAFHGLTCDDARPRQIALELLDMLLDPGLCRDLAQAVGGVRASRSRRRPGHAPLIALASDPDPVLASIARAVIAGQGDGDPDGAAGAAHAEPGADQQPLQRILALESIRLFRHVSVEDLTELASLLVPLDAARGTTLFREGESADAMYFLRSGEVTLARNHRAVLQLGSGEAFGVVAVLDRRPRQVTAVATTDSSLLSLPAEDLLKLVGDHPRLMHALFKGLTATIRSNVDRLA